MAQHLRWKGREWSQPCGRFSLSRRKGVPSSEGVGVAGSPLREFRAGVLTFLGDVAARPFSGWWQNWWPTRWTSLAQHLSQKCFHPQNQETRAGDQDHGLNAGLQTWCVVGKITGRGSGVTAGKGFSEAWPSGKWGSEALCCEAVRKKGKRHVLKVKLGHNEKMGSGPVEVVVRPWSAGA